MQVRRPFFISLVDIVFKKISSKKEFTCVFPSQPPPCFLISGMYSPQYNISERTSEVGQLLFESSKRTGLSLSLYLYLSRSGWFHDEVPKKLMKPKKKPLAMDVNLLLSQLLD